MKRFSLTKLLCVLVLLGACIGSAHAVTRDQAWSQCLARAAQRDGTNPTNAPHSCAQAFIAPDGNSGSYVVTINTGAHLGSLNYPWSGSGCSGRWNEAAKKCVPSEAQCRDKAARGSGLISGTATSGCIGDCEFGPPDGGRTLSFNGSDFITLSKGWVPTGGMCQAQAPQPNESDPQLCKNLASGQTACAKQDGKVCYKGPIGSSMQFCWQPGETGEKNDGNVRQKRNAGDQPISPENIALPSGDTLQQSGAPTVTNVTNNNQSSITTTQNYTTENGTEANGGGKPSTDGEPGDGSGDGEGEGNEGSAGGGGDCSSPPITTGDPVMGMVATQAWHARCATEAGNAANVTGDVGNCAQPFTVTGTNANAQQLRAMRAEICKGDSNGDGQPDWTAGEGDYEGDAGESDEPPTNAIELGIDMLDQGGFGGGGGTCPALGALDFGPFGTFDLDSEPYWCQLVAILALIIPLFGAFTAIRILME